MARGFPILMVLFWLWPAAAAGAAAPISEATQECLDCHATFHPGITADWQASRHATVTPGQAAARQGVARKVSSDDVPEALQTVAVGCAECHSLRNDQHADAFEHNGADIHVVVSPDDCATCHSQERSQYADNIMAHARKNLAQNPVYQDLQRTILGTPSFTAGTIAFAPDDALTRADACYYCHGTRIEVTGHAVRETDAGELEFPVMTGWPNQGVGRINPDGSAGACTACHTRHQFSIEMARKPYTCKECHVGPDVPAFKVYTASKHGNIFSSLNHQWDFSPVPWTIGQDFTAPTCAACHISLLVNADGEVVVERTHTMSDRLAWRIFGLIYAHPQPKSPDTTVIRNSQGLSLPTDFDGGLATEFLIDANEQAARRERMGQTCSGCHDTSWTEGFFKRLDHTIHTSNRAIRTATQVMEEIWKNEFASGLGQKKSPFDEFAERRWTDVWLLYANNIRFVSAMAGGGDYGVFEDGRYHLTNAVVELQSWLDTQMRLSGRP